MRALFRTGSAIALGCALMTLGCAIPSQPAAAQTSMGVNYNGTFTAFNITDVTNSQTTWIRGFYDITALLKQDGTCAVSTVQSDSNLTEINTIHKSYSQYRLALNLKYDFSEWGGGTPPTDTSSTEYTTLQTCTNRVLDYVYPSLSQLVSGNEPFITITGQSVPIFIQVVRSFLISARILMRRMESLRRRLRASPFGRERRNISMTC